MFPMLFWGLMTCGGVQARRLPAHTAPNSRLLPPTREASKQHEILISRATSNTFLPSNRCPYIQALRPPSSRDFSHRVAVLPTV